MSRLFLAVVLWFVFSPATHIFGADCRRRLSQVTPTTFYEALLQHHGRSNVVEMSDWLSRFPICLNGISGGRSSPIHLKDAWIEFVLEMSKPLAQRRGLQLVGLEVEKSESLVFVSDHYWRHWQNLGFFDDRRAFQKSISLFQLSSRFRKWMRSVGHPMEVYVPSPGALHWKGEFLSSKDFAVSILSGLVPIDDLHAIFFHLPDLMEESRRTYFLWATRFLELEALYREIKQQERQGSLWVSERLFHENFEGTAWPDSKTISGYIQLMSIHLRGVGPPTQWDPAEWEQLKSQPAEEILRSLDIKGFPLPKGDQSHWREIIPVVVKLAEHFYRDIRPVASYFYSRDKTFEQLYQEFLKTP